jgi:DNA-binding response OmpR family regulator
MKVVRVLVVEDEVRLAATLRRGLTADGFAVDVANDGSSGLWKASEQDYDAIILDIMLPRLNGYEVCRRLREAGNWTPIVMLTAKSGEFDEAEALDIGADDFLRKPFSYVVLVARMRALLRRGQPERPTLLRCGNLCLDPAAHQCSRGGEPVRLTAREFAVLEYLMRRAGDVVSRTEIMAHVWDYAFESDSNVVEVHVSALRRKIDGPFDRHAIETVRGVGYRLDPSGG